MATLTTDFKPSEQRSPRLRLGLAVRLLLAILVARPFLDQYREVGLGPLQVTDLLGVGLLGLAAVSVIVGDLPSVGRVAGQVFFSIYLTWVCALGLWIELTNSSPLFLAAIVKILTIFAVFSVAARITRLHGPALVYRALLASGLAPLGFGAWQLVRGEGLQPTEYSPDEEQLVRVLSTFSHPNALAIYACVIVLLGFHILTSRMETKVWRAVALADVVLGLMSLFGSYTRIAWLAVPIAVLLGATTAGRRFWLTAVGGFAIFTIWTLDIGGVSQRFGSDSSVSYRTDLWSALLHQVTTSDLLFGLGAGHVEPIVAATTARLGLTRVDEVHNDYLRVLLEGGVVGFALYLACVGAILAVALRTRTSADPATALTGRIGVSTVALLVFLSATDNIYSDVVLQIAFWAVLGMVAACGRDEPAGAGRRG